MYRDHVPIIAEAAANGAPAFTRVCMFAVLSARQQFVTVPDQFEALDRDGEGSEFLFSWKLGAYRYLRDNETRLWRKIMAIPKQNAAQAIAALCEVPGLGIVKAAFALQMMGWDCACLDTRNIKREKRDPRAYRSDGEARKSGPAWQRKIARYCAETAGKAEFYWDTWCAEVGQVYDLTADNVSAIHLIVAENS